MGKDEVTIIDEIKNYNISDWENWIEDILFTGFAYPVKRFSADGNVFVEMHVFLTTNGIAPQYIEQAIANILVKYIANVHVVENIVDELLFAIISIKSNRHKKMLLDFVSNPFLSSEIIKEKVRNCALQTLGRLLLSSNEKKIVCNTFNIQLYDELSTNPSLCGNFLRFLRLQFEPGIFLSEITKVIKSNIHLDAALDSETVTTDMAIVIADKFEEHFYYNAAVFYSSTLEWFRDSFHLFNYNLLYKNVLFRIFEFLNTVFDISNFDQHELQSEETEARYGLSFSLNFIFNFKDEYFKKSTTWENCANVFKKNYLANLLGRLYQNVDQIYIFTCDNKLICGQKIISVSLRSFYFLQDQFSFFDLESSQVEYDKRRDEYSRNMRLRKRPRTSIQKELLYDIEKFEHV